MRSMPIHPDTVAPAATQPPALRVHRGRRAAVLIGLKSRGRATARQLAEGLHCSLNAIRHHLKELEAEGVVDHDAAPHGVGAPAHTYWLTPAGHALFPDRYQQTVAELLDHLVANEGRAAAVELLETHYRSLARRALLGGEDLSAEERGALIARLLDDEGYMATWVASAEGVGGTLTEHNCPHQVVAERFPEICEAEEAFLARVFGAVIERQSRITSGCGTCSYHVTQLVGKDDDAS
jgi:DeoR family transcriptional regulator, suf operon transcriptional repressor